MPRSHHATLDLQSGPPPEVLAEIDAAWGRAQVAFDGGLELHLVADGETQRAYGELRRPDGRVECRLTASQVVALACGEPIGPRRAALAAWLVPHVGSFPTWLSNRRTYSAPWRAWAEVRCRRWPASRGASAARRTTAA